ncbi:MAG TPA: hypothetical protein PLY42_19130 [Nitrospira sp.]|nr:hypothetical protein [Nitrospira sp.]MBX3371403.1 hypothetical protein [Nitrospira sp.]MBX7040149.1 hypothetical protein [Nitrospira sp.]HMU30426.1 hypothetical protein [Nitrospira sp.]HMX93492.1 hypothetical protein [Nitrospira sp.]
MTDIPRQTSPRLRMMARLGVWISLLGGLLLPWIIMLTVEILVRDIPYPRAWRSFTLHLFAPGYNFFFVGVLTALPFVILALIILFHLGTAPANNALIAYRRALGLFSAGLSMALIAAWVHVDVLIHPDAQGALAYFYLPILLLMMLPFGYGLGRALAKIFLPRLSG